MHHVQVVVQFLSKPTKGNCLLAPGKSSTDQEYRMAIRIAQEIR